MCVTEFKCPYCEKIIHAARVYVVKTYDHVSFCGKDNEGRPTIADFPSETDSQVDECVCPLCGEKLDDYLEIL